MRSAKLTDVLLKTSTHAKNGSAVVVSWTAGEASLRARSGSASDGAGATATAPATAMAAPAAAYERIFWAMRTLLLREVYTEPAPELILI